ncbi:aconitate hydratase domain protein [Sulfolobus islandicus Y.N.15.51]|jgi:aconitate hydratase|uniref:Aconitate hydratase domain protein n=1 Tax=Saccharolobus islandicus (strain Y.N.15.51 / Yellowstone \|nr:aconitate hydratase AcnA [Sulfolobus islandicus]ACP49111.1 aconitate hydratase domain protein [Sulfolobus islandicus Y.N.15.51]
MKLKLNALTQDIYYVPLNQFEYNLDNLPYVSKIIIENVIAHNINDIDNKLVNNLLKWEVGEEIPLYPNRIVMQDYTGIPVIADLTALRDVAKNLGLDVKKISPMVQVDLIIDHSVQVDYFKRNDAIKLNMRREIERNLERFSIIKWAQNSINNLRVIPPGNGIIHEINLEFLSDIVTIDKLNDLKIAHMDFVLGTDSHTTMINGIGVLGWGVGGIEAELVMFNEPYYIKIPEIIGIRLNGKLKHGVTPTDVALYITQQLRKRNLVGKFVEFFGDGLVSLSAFDRATISNMAPEYGVTVAYFPIDSVTLNYYSITNRNVKLIMEYLRVQNLLYSNNTYHNKLKYQDVIDINLEDVEPSIAGPRYPYERIELSKSKEFIYNNIIGNKKKKGKYIEDGSITLAAITSCTNTANPLSIIIAALLAKNAIKYNLNIPWYVKTSFAPGSKIVEEYLNDLGLLEYLDKLGFNIVAFGCTTCIGNTGPLLKEVEEDIKNNGIITFGVISGNRNFEGRIHPLLNGVFLASPPMVIAYAIAGRIDIQLDREPLGYDNLGNAVYLKDIWPTSNEINEALNKIYNKFNIYHNKIAKIIINSNDNWKEVKSPSGEIFDWSFTKQYIKRPPWFDEENKHTLNDIVDARVLGLFGDDVTTDHISPAGPIPTNSTIYNYMISQGIKPEGNLGSYRANHEIYIRSAFLHPKLKNYLNNKEGGLTLYLPEMKEMTFYEASQEYAKNNIPLIIIAGKRFGMGSSRDTAAKIIRLLNVKAVLAESFERIFRENLVLMGVVPILIPNWKSLNISGEEKFSIKGLSAQLKPKQDVLIEIKTEKSIINIKGKISIETEKELKYLAYGGAYNYIKDKILYHRQ